MASSSAQPTLEQLAAGQPEPGAVALLVEDPDLAVGISAEERSFAERLVIVSGFLVETGAIDLTGLASEPNLGLLVLDGFVTVNVGLADRVDSQLAGPGDILHGALAGPMTLPTSVSHFVSERVRVAVLDRRFITAVRRWPELLVALHERLRLQEHRLAVHAAIGKLRRVEDRVLAVLWQLGERWGRVTPDGVLVPLALTHATIGRLAGAERPTVSLALAELAASGEVQRRDDGALVLRADSWERLAPTAAMAPQVRALAVQHTPDVREAPSDTPAPPRGDLNLDALPGRIDALHEGLPERARNVDEVLAAARAAAERSRMTRARIQEQRQARLRG